MLLKELATIINNEYKEFHQREVEAHICASFMEMSGMKTFTGNSIVQLNVIHQTNLTFKMIENH